MGLGLSPSAALGPQFRRLVRVLAGGIEVARSDRTLRVLETSHPPVYYIPPDDVLTSALQRVAGSSFCEWKGVASYYDFVTGERRIARAAWTYTDPTPSFAELANYVAFYPSRVDECFVGDERVRPQVGDFYGDGSPARSSGRSKELPALKAGDVPAPVGRSR
jgi:uncharacterized protein (DUF427 family)